MFVNINLYFDFMEHCLHTKTLRNHLQKFRTWVRYKTKYLKSLHRFTTNVFAIVFHAGHSYTNKLYADTFDAGAECSFHFSFLWPGTQFKPLASVCYDCKIAEGDASAESDEDLYSQYLGNICSRFFLKSHFQIVLNYGKAYILYHSMTNLVTLWISYINYKRFYTSKVQNIKKQSFLAFITCQTNDYISTIWKITSGLKLLQGTVVRYA